MSFDAGSYIWQKLLIVVIFVAFLNVTVAFGTLHGNLTWTPARPERQYINLEMPVNKCHHGPSVVCRFIYWLTSSLQCSLVWEISLEFSQFSVLGSFWGIIFGLMVKFLVMAFFKDLSVVSTSFGDNRNEWNICDFNERILYETFEFEWENTSLFTFYFCLTRIEDVTLLGL